MFCVIQKIWRKRPESCGEYREIEAYQVSWTIEDKPPMWDWRYTGGRFERPHLEAYKITLHQSYRESGRVKKRQYTVCTMSYYDFCSTWWGECIVGGETALAEKLGMDAAELCRIIDAKVEPLPERIRAEFEQSAEYIAQQEHERIKTVHWAAQLQFCEKYGVDKSEYDRCYDVFGQLRNKEYLKQIKAEYKARQQSEREARKQHHDYWRSYQEQWRSTYSGQSGGQSSGSYSVPSVSTYTDADRVILKQFYRSLSKLYHPDLNPDKDTKAQMQMLNRLKEQWGV